MTAALAAPSSAQVKQIVAFESQFFSAQQDLTRAGSLSVLGSQGGPEFLSATAAAAGTNAVTDPNYVPMTRRRSRRELIRLKL
jgi:hypothetical protein